MRYFLKLMSVVVVAVLAAYPAYATEPGQTVNPNGFPSGEHYNLNLSGKKATFICPQQQYDEFGNPAYGNVIFMPQNGTGVKILMESGAGAKAASITTLQVTDACAKFDGTPAVVQIPPNKLGYRVYARSLGKPTNRPSVTIVPDLISVQDEFGNDLVYLGLVTSNGFQMPYATFTREKGKSTAVNITGLFDWSGDVCYFNTTYCLAPDQCTATTMCCGLDASGQYQNCEPKTTDYCPDGTIDTTTYCRTYTNAWVFNIADFVSELWSLDNTGMKLLQVRFYPVH